VLDRHFPAVPATLHVHAINSVPVHRFHQGKVLFLMATAENTPEMRQQSVRCITIHSLRNHECHFEPFSGGKTCDFLASAGKARTGRFSGARYETLW